MIQTNHSNSHAEKDSLQHVRRIQKLLQQRYATNSRHQDFFFWTPLTSGPYLVPVTRLIE